MGFQAHSPEQGLSSWRACLASLPAVQGSVLSQVTRVWSVFAPGIRYLLPRSRIMHGGFLAPRQSGHDINPRDTEH